MPFSRLRSSLSLAVVLAAASVVPAQTAPTSGEITVQLTEGLDSATNPKSMSHGVVTKSSNPSIPNRTPAIVGLASDPINGGYTAKLVALQINGRTVPAASSAAALGPDLLGKLHLGNQGNAVAGTHVFLPAQTFVRFTLTEPPARTPPPPPVPAYTAPAAPVIPSFVKWDKLDDLMTKDLVTACTAQDGEHQAFCYGVLMLFYDQTLAAADSENYKPSFCLPPAATAGQLRDAFLNDARKRSDQVDSPISLFFYQTWENEFPCPKASPKPRRPPAKKKP